MYVVWPQFDLVKHTGNNPVVSADNRSFRQLIKKADKLSQSAPPRTLFSPQTHTQILSVLQTRPNLVRVSPRLLRASDLMNSQCCRLLGMTDVVAMRKLTLLQSLINAFSFAAFLRFVVFCNLAHKQAQQLNLLHVCDSCKWQQKRDQAWEKNYGHEEEGKSKSSHQRGEFSKWIWACQIQTAGLTWDLPSAVWEYEFVRFLF